LLLRISDATSASLLVIEHDIPLITSISDEIVAMDLGRVIARGPADEIARHPQVIASYLGSSEEAIARSGAVPAAVVGVTSADDSGRRSDRRPSS
jgi:branched-chain amino acid transport system ATP-binding protein